MANAIVQVEAPTGLTLTLSLYAFSSDDTLANSGGADTLTEKTNNKGLYAATVTEGLSGWHWAKILDGSSNLIAHFAVWMSDTTNIHRCVDLSDLYAWTGAAVTLSTGNKPDVNVDEISDDATAPATLELFAEALDQATGQIDSGTFAAAAIDAAAIATDAIGSLELSDAAALKISDAVWDEIIAGHAIAGSTGEALSAAGAAGDPWITSLPGSYTGSQAGKVIADILVDTGTTLQGELDGIQADTEDIQSRLPAALTAGGNIKADVIAVSGDATAADTLELFVEALDQATGQLDSGSLAAGTITAASIAADAIGASELAADAVAEIADAVWDELLSGHAVSGSTGEALSAAGSAGDPWITDLPGSYTGTQAGKILADVLVDTGTTLQGELDGIQADTEDIQTRLPAALVGGRIDANVGAISTDATAADTLELFVEALDQATGQLDSGSLAAGTITATSIASDAITDAKVASDVTIASVTGAVGSVTGAVGSVTGNVGGNVVGSVGSLATQAKADVNAEVDSALNTAIPGSPTADSINERVRAMDIAIGEIYDVTASVYLGTVVDASPTSTVFETNITGYPDNALNDQIVIFESGTLDRQAKPILLYEQNVSNGRITVSEAFTSAPANGDTFSIRIDHVHPVAQIADGVWDEDLSGHSTAGTGGKLVTDANTAVTSGTHGNAALKTLIDAVDDYIDTEVAAIKTKTDQLTFTSANKVDATLQAAADIATAVAQKIAHVILRRTMANVEAASDGDTLALSSLYGLAQMMQEASISGTTLTVKQTDGSTTLGTKTLTTDDTADPVTAIT